MKVIILQLIIKIVIMPSTEKTYKALAFVDCKPTVQFERQDRKIRLYQTEFQKKRRISCSIACKSIESRMLARGMGDFEYATDSH